MRSTEEQLAAIGFGGSRSEPACWRAVRLDRPMMVARSAEARREPVCSRTLMRWRELLARSPRASCYRISRIAG
jgi:hypothetical protein